ncbi:STN domain-containing protein, partial [Butyricimonas sp. An62]|uniref:STN domain-containing protein n=1 Tax=Butyricimonas sp. An62 TaxID=1965649 RepID=UPI0030811A00
MKLITFFLFLGLFHVSAATFAQRETVTFSLDRMTVDEVFSTIRKQLKYDIFYSNEELDATKVVQLSSKEMSVEAVLREILQGRYSFEFIEKTIVIRPVALQKEKRVTIQGVVKNTNGETLPGVSVLVKGTTLGTITDMNGRYSINNVPVNAKSLVISFVGMKTQELAIKGGEQRVVMQSDTELIDEVVVVAYGTQKKSSFTG